MLPEDAILLPEIVDAIFLVASHPASQVRIPVKLNAESGEREHGFRRT